MKLREIKEDLKDISPIFVRKFIKQGLKTYRKKRNRFAFKIAGKKVTEDDLFECFRKLGIKNGDIVLIHSSLSRLGYVEGGAVAIIEALQRAVGSKGTIGAPTFWGHTTLYLNGQKTFNANESHSILGAVSENIRKHPDAERSLHPTHSAAFVGPAADYLIKNHHLDNTPVGPNSPYHKLAKIRGKILLLGASLEYLTNFHTIENEYSDFCVPIFLEDPITFKVIDREKNVRNVTTYVYDPESNKKAKGIKMGRYLIENNILKERKVGNTTAKLLDAKLLHQTLIKLFENGITMYNPGF